ncbi:MAG TPA: sigma-70 family RNA polymerase sigma factor [Gaiellaceae bacterium]|nr:sigma-70 family RNA polymerase sigma factor [Gaiellaceae bacterium]
MGVRLEEIEAVYRGCAGQFVQVAQAITGDRERATEAVQDAFANAIRSRRSYRGDGPLEAWLWRAVVNAARQAVRRPLVEVGREEARYELPPQVAELAPLVARLPERQRLIVFLRYYADLDYRSIAAALELEVGTVSSALAAAHASIRKSIRQVGTDA